MRDDLAHPSSRRHVKKKELNRDRWEERETKAYLAGDPVDADFPGVTMVIRTFRRTWKVVWKGKRDNHGRKLYVKVGKPTQEVAWHVTSLAPEDLGCEGDACVEKLARHVRAHWYVEVYHGKRDNGYHEDKLTRRMDLNIMSAMMVARSLGMWVCARNPGKSTEAMQRDFLRHPSKLMRIMTKGGLL